MMRPSLLPALLVSIACEDGRIDLERMKNQDRYDPYEWSEYFEGPIMRTPPEGTVHRAQLIGPSDLRHGVSGSEYIRHIPVSLNHTLLERGQNRFGIFCAPCHGLAGDGVSQVAENMRLRPPPSLHEPRLRAYPSGRLYRVIEQGYGLMPSYAQELAVADRWAVVAFVQALQLSQSVGLAELPPEVREGAKKWLQ